MPSYLAKAVREHDNPPSHVRDRLCERVRRQFKRFAFASKLHLDLQGIVGCGEVIANHAIEHRDKHLTLH